MDWYEFGKIAALAARPSVIVLLLLAGGCALLWLAPARAFGRYMVTAAAGILLALSYGVLVDPMGRDLEDRHAALLDTTAIREAKWVVVLGGGHYSGPALPVTSRISSVSLHRIAEGIRLHRELPGSTIVFSGAAVVDGVSIAQLSRELALLLGVPAERIVIIDNPRNTAEEARCVSELVRKDPFVLVTSALHMSRALAFFDDRGMHPVPAPTYHRQGLAGSGLERFIPSMGNLAKADMVLHEFLGMAWARTDMARHAADARFAAAGACGHR